MRAGFVGVTVVDLSAPNWKVVRLVLSSELEVVAVVLLMVTFDAKSSSAKASEVVLSYSLVVVVVVVVLRAAIADCALASSV